ncbi:MAG: DUF1631 family protein [Caldimonas sp.]
MPIDPLYQRFVDDELALAPALVERVLAGTQQLLGESHDGSMSASERTHHADLFEELQRGAQTFAKTFLESLRRQVAEDLAGGERDAGSDVGTGLGGLELMDETRVEVDIEISRALQIIDSTAEWELRELQTFTSTLTGREHVSSESNPFRPLVYATALWDAACAIASSQIQRAIVLRTSAGVAAGLLKNAWAAASTRLESQGVQPGAYRTVVLPSGASFSRLAHSEPSRVGALSALLSSMPGTQAGSPGRRDGAGEGEGGGAVRSDGAARRNPELEQALLRLDELLRHAPSEASLTGSAKPRSVRIEQHRAALVASATESLDRQVIELVTRLFESLLSDSQLPAPTRPILSRMQIAILRLALAEPSILDAYDHPTWRLLNRIGETSLGYSRIEDPRLAGFLSFAGAVAEEMAGATTPDTSLFRRGLNRIDIFSSEQLQAQLRGAQAAIEALQLAERRELLQQHLGQRLTDQMVPVRTTPAIRRFVTGTWAKVIAEDMIRHGEQSEATMADVKTVDDLLWSLKIPDHPQSRHRLLSLLPGLLQRLRSGMELVAVPAQEQQAVLDDLMTIHTEALRPGPRGGAASGGTLTPEEIVQRMRDEILPEAPSVRSFSDSVIDLSSMETVPAEVMPSSGSGEPEDDPAKRVEAMRAGNRHRIFLHGKWKRVQMLWRSDRGLFFLFAGDSPTRTHSITHRALERLSSAGLVQPIESKALVQRAVDRMMRELSPRG